MTDAFKQLYDRMAARKGEASAMGVYNGGNGRIDRAVDIISGYAFSLPASGGCLLDVGGATGNLGYALRDRFERRIVVDIAEDCRLPAVSKGNEFFCKNVDITGLPGEDNSVDLIVALDFIEHIIDPEKFARECRRVLKSGGDVLINTPNIQFWRHVESLAVNGIFPHTSGDTDVYHGGHVAFYNLRDMLKIFDDGFIGQRMHTQGMEPDPPPQLWVNLLNVPTSKLKTDVLSYADLVFSCRKL